MALFFQISQWFDLVVFTASMEVYGSAVADKLDRNKGILNRRYYRQVVIYISFGVSKKYFSSYTVVFFTMISFLMLFCILPQVFFKNLFHIYKKIFNFFFLAL